MQQNVENSNVCKSNLSLMHMAESYFQNERWEFKPRSYRDKATFDKDQTSTSSDENTSDDDGLEIVKKPDSTYGKHFQYTSILKT